ncbi:MAG TPA: FixH family protein [Solirubrobacter sp.]|nr:FixH family protein [Solirubrobacter sp.]
MRRVLIALPVLVLLVFAPPAVAGGWATVGLSSTPAGTDPGAPWNVTLTVLQHGRTPLDGLQPTITIRNGDATERFAAKPAGAPGTYRASVTFPTAGTWTYEVDDGFITGQPHTFPPVEIGDGSAGAPGTSDDGGGSLGWLAIPGVALLLAAGFLLAGDRRRRHHQPQAA